MYQHMLKEERSLATVNKNKRGGSRTYLKENIQKGLTNERDKHKKRWQLILKEQRSRATAYRNKIRASTQRTQKQRIRESTKTMRDEREVTTCL